MKLICEVSVYNRLAPHVKPRSQQSTLALGYHPPGAAKDPENLFLIHFNATNKAGTRYKIKRNVEKVFTKFVNDGKTTISMKQPPHDLLIRCDPIQLKTFLQTFKVALDGKLEASKLNLSTLAVTGVPQKSMPAKKMTITSPADYPLKGLPKSLTTLNINDIRKHSIDGQILNLINLRVLNLSNNRIERIPKRLGEMPLVQLDLSSNHLFKSSFFTDWDWADNPTIQNALQTLNLGDNQLTYFPKNIMKLSKLSQLTLKSNQLTRIPFGVRRLTWLRYFNVSENQIESLPNTITRLTLDTLELSGDKMLRPLSDADEAAAQADGIHESHDIVRQPAKLWQLAAKTVMIKRVKYGPSDLPANVIELLQEAPICVCGKLCPSGKIYFKSCKLRIRANHLVMSHGRSTIYGDAVYCNDYCRNK